MDLYQFGFTLHVLGELIVALSVILIHARVSKEHKIDRKVISSINHEKWLTLLGVLFIVCGYLLELPFK